MSWKNYRKVNVQPMRPYIPGESLERVKISKEDEENGSPKEGDMIAQNPENTKDRWLVAKKFFEENYILVEE